MKLFIVALSLALLCISEDVSSGRRSPTPDEQQTFLPILKIWMVENWQNKMEYTGGYINQKLKDIDFCCIDSFEKHELYIVDIVFHAKWLERSGVVDEADMAQRLLLRVVNGRIKDWDPMPAHRINMETQTVQGF